MPAPLSILYQDEAIVAVDKPAGLLVHRTGLDHHETSFALQMVRDQLGSHVYPVHRLDKPTSGVLVFARSPEIAAALQSQFREHSIRKQYLAIVRGWMAPSGVIDYALRSDPDRRRDDPANPSREARTHFETLSTVELPFAVGRYPTARYALVRIQPQTGRRHQIRRHLKHVFHPIIGDRKYGDDRHSRFVASEYGCEALLLSSISIQFIHPLTLEPVLIEAASPTWLVHLSEAWHIPASQTRI